LAAHCFGQKVGVAREHYALERYGPIEKQRRKRPEGWVVSKDSRNRLDLQIN
jgi:hypothetical protein